MEEARLDENVAGEGATTQKRESEREREREREREKPDFINLFRNICDCATEGILIVSLSLLLRFDPTT
ncbi:MAG: hypothetical protein J8272_00695, partial ['Prunus persica' phytoplasma PP2]|nr:hypothetical protein ['Prunus persica' phytoplasma PP2]